MVDKKKKAGRFANLARQARGEEEIPEPQPTQEPQIELEQENPTKKPCKALCGGGSQTWAKRI